VKIKNAVRRSTKHQEHSKGASTIFVAGNASTNGEESDLKNGGKYET
jgi:hypothetical protein